MFSCLVISQKTSLKRRKKITECLNQCDIPFDFVDACSPVDAQNYENSLDDDKYLKSFYRPLSFGEIACALSHKKALEQFLSSDYANMLLLEDDAFIDVGNVNTLLEVENLLATFDLIKLSSGKRAKKMYKEVRSIKGFSFGYPEKVPNSNLGQWVSRNGATKMVEIYSNISAPADILLQPWWKNDMKIGFCQPPIVEESGATSEIDATQKRKQLPSSRFQKVRSKIDFEIKNRCFNFLR